MDSSSSQQQSQPSSSSPDPGSGSGFNDSCSGPGSGLNASNSGSGFNGSSSNSGFNGSSSNSAIRSGSGGSTGNTSSSSGNNTSEGHDNSSSSMKSKSSTGYEPEDEEDMDVDIIGLSEPEPESSTGKGKMVSNREGNPGDIGLLADLYTFYNKTGRYLMSASNDQRDFYKFWIEEEGDFGYKEELDSRIVELHARFLKNMEKDVEGPTDPIDVEILRLSYWIWGDEIEKTDADDVIASCEESAVAADGDDGDGDEEQVLKDSSDVNMADVGGNGNDDQSGHETADVRHGVDHDHMDLKDSTKESGSIGKDSPSKAN